jgi:hypothetical protein
MAAYIGSQYFKEVLFPPPSERVATPAELSLSEIQPIAITKDPGVTAKVSNSSASLTFEPAMYELSFLEGEKLLFVCEAYKERPQLGPGTSAVVQITCPEVSRAALPTTVQYKLRIRNAWKFRPQ